VISDLPVLREIFNDGEDALMVRHDDINAWTQTVDRLRNDPDLRRRLGEMAIENVRNHSWPDRAKLVLSGLN